MKRKKFTMRHPVAQKVEDILADYPWYNVWLEDDGPQAIKYKKIIVQKSRDNTSQVERLVVNNKAELLSRIDTIEEVIDIMQNSDRYKNELKLVTLKYFEGKYNEKVARMMKIDINTFYKYQRNAILKFAKAFGWWI